VGSSLGSEPEKNKTYTLSVDAVAQPKRFRTESALVALKREEVISPAEKQRHDDRQCGGNITI
jgi:hypothetical protein